MTVFLDMRTARFVISGGRCMEGVLRSENMLETSDGSKYGAREVTWLPPVVPTKIVGLVLNYADHASELALPLLRTQYSS